MRKLRQVRAPCLVAPLVVGLAASAVTSTAAAGTDGLVHVFVDTAADDGFVRVIQQRGTFVVATLSVSTAARVLTTAHRRRTDSRPHRPGLRADRGLVNGDPSADINTIRDIATIWKYGYLVECTHARHKNVEVVKPR